MVFLKFIEKHLCQSLFFNKVADLSLQAKGPRNTATATIMINVEKECGLRKYSDKYNKSLRKTTMMKLFLVKLQTRRRVTLFKKGLYHILCLRCVKTDY